MILTPIILGVVTFIHTHTFEIPERQGKEEPWWRLGRWNLSWWRLGRWSWGQPAGGGEPGRAEEPMRPGNTEDPGDQEGAAVTR